MTDGTVNGSGEVLVTLKMWPGDVSDRYREMLLYQSDLAVALGAALLWCEEYEAPADEAAATIGTALATSALMRFVSCFRHRNNPGLDPDEVYPNGPDGARAYFSYLKDIRDAFIGHRFGPLRQAAPLIEIHHETGDLMRVVGVPLIWTPSVEQLGVELVGMIQQAQDHVDRSLQDLSDELVAQIQAMSAAERQALPNGGFRVPGPEDFRTDRNRYQARHGTTKGRHPEG